MYQYGTANVISAITQVPLHLLGDTDGCVQHHCKNVPSGALVQHQLQDTKDRNPCAEVGPLIPVAIGGGGLAIRQPLSDVFCRSTEAIPEESLGGGVHSRHDIG